ncbi:hypothetical protein [Coleofasciculus sp. H7-2]|uniref:hypothetical protein n=1 Tax=Coleofasciculus sp. H7-2 TaxID=3351545 RepID=UPI00366DE8C8
MRFGKILGVFVAGAPQLAPPQVEANTGLTFELQTFKSAAIGEVPTYCLILPFAE